MRTVSINIHAPSRVCAMKKAGARPAPKSGFHILGTRVILLLAVTGLVVVYRVVDHAVMYVGKSRKLANVQGLHFRVGAERSYVPDSEKIIVGNYSIFHNPCASVLEQLHLFIIDRNVYSFHGSRPIIGSDSEEGLRVARVKDAYLHDGKWMPPVFKDRRFISPEKTGIGIRREY